MKKVLALSAAAVVMATAGTAMAAGTGTLTVSANVTKSCLISGAATIAFGALDPTNAIAKNVPNQTGVQVTCTNGAGMTVTKDTGLHGSGGVLYLSDGASHNIPYTLTVTAPASGTGAAQDVLVSGDIAAGAYSTAPFGNYGDTVTLTVAAN